MAKARKPPHDDSQIEEIDLSLIDTNFIDLSIDEVESSREEKAKTKKLSGTHDEVDFALPKDDVNGSDGDFDAPVDFEDDFEDDFDEFDDIDDDDDDTDGEKKDGYKSPKDFFTDKRRKKNLKKFIDVTVPPEFLE